MQKEGTQQYLKELNSSEVEQMNKWGFLKNIININTFFASRDEGSPKETTIKAKGAQSKAQTDVESKDSTETSADSIADKNEDEKKPEVKKQ